MPVEPKNPPPLYAPETAARVILHCAETPKRDVFVGAGGKGISLLGRFAPHLADKIMERTMIKQQQSNRPAGASQENGLYRSSGDLKERGGYVGHVAESSLYTRGFFTSCTDRVSAGGSGISRGGLLARKTCRRPIVEIADTFNSVFQ